MRVNRRVLLAACAALLPAAAQLFALPAAAKVYAKKLAFQDSDAFDSALAKDMREGFEAIDVELAPAFGKRMPARLRAWLEAIESSGGEIRFRDVTPASRGFWLLLAEFVVGIVGGLVASEIARAARSPAGDYHAVIVGQGVDPATAEVLGVEFYKRGSPSWAEAFDKSKAMKLRS